MKIGIFGNCQSVGMAASISALVPDAKVHRFGVHEAQTASAERIKAEMDIFSDCDYVFTQPSLAHGIKGLLPDDFSARCKNPIPYPLITSRFLHPDCHYISNDEGGHIQGPLGPYQSGIAAGAYLSDLPIDRTISLFNIFTYHKLGYLCFEGEDEAISREAQRFSYDFGAFLKGDHGHFMHTINHPRIEILFETARQGLNKAGISCDESAVLPDDWLGQNYVWPVYPGMAKNFPQLGGEIRFRHPRGDIDKSLPEFLEASYEAFSAANGAFRSDLSDKVKAFIETHVI